MTRIASALAALCFATLVLTGCSSPGGGDAPDGETTLERIQRTGVVRIGYALFACSLVVLVSGFLLVRVFVDLKHPAMMPVREPLRSLIYVAQDRAVRDVFVAGEQVVRDGECLTIDLTAASQALEEAQARSMAKVPERDWAGRTTDELAPMALPALQG